MNKALFFPKTVFVTSSALKYETTKQIINNLSSIPVKVIKESADIIPHIEYSVDPIKESKKFLLLDVQAGGFVKPCPCTPYYIGCNYYIINIDLQCPLDCSYCILQDYLSVPAITVFVNRNKLWRELEVFIKKRGGKRFRIGSGELSDSLALDHITNHSRDLISFFRKKPGALFEFKTKTTNISNLMNEEPSENIIISWSLNTPTIVKQEEKGAPSVEERIDAAAALVKKGFKVGFHFDPIIYYPGWKEDYEGVSVMLMESIPLERIAWISLGSLRFPKNLKKIIKDRFPETKIIDAEMITGIDGKLRYFRSLRSELYLNIINAFRKHAEGKRIPFYFCMESSEIWKEGLKKEPRDKKDVELYLLSRGF